ncbi:MAG: hypothetical protein QW292_03980 [Candidatus Parvarchaeota archaeon]
MSEIFQDNMFTAEEMNRIIPGYLREFPSPHDFRWKIVRKKTFISSADGKQHTSFWIFCLYKDSLRESWEAFDILHDGKVNMEEYKAILESHRKRIAEKIKEKFHTSVSFMELR